MPEYGQTIIRIHQVKKGLLSIFENDLKIKELCFGEMKWTVEQNYYTSKMFGI